MFRHIINKIKRWGETSIIEEIYQMVSNLLKNYMTKSDKKRLICEKRGKELDQLLKKFKTVKSVLY